MANWNSFPVDVEFGLQCTNPDLREQLAAVYVRKPNEIHFEPIELRKWGRNINASRTEPIRCKICLQLHAVNECELYKCRHCSMFHTAFGNCSLHSSKLKKRDMIALAANKVKSGLYQFPHTFYSSHRSYAKPKSFDTYVPQGATQGATQGTMEEIEDSSNPHWRRSRTSAAMKASFKKRHWKKNIYHYKSL
jgi:hypothetical protein